MQEKISELEKIADEFSDKSEKYYVFIKRNFGELKKIEVSIRDKKNYEFIETREVYLKEVDLSVIDELIEFIKNYE